MSIRNPDSATYDLVARLLKYDNTIPEAVRVTFIIALLNVALWILGDMKRDELFRRLDELESDALGYDPVDLYACPKVKPGSEN